MISKLDFEMASESKVLFAESNQKFLKKELLWESVASDYHNRH